MLPPCEAVGDGRTVALRLGRCKVLFGFDRCVVLGFRWMLIFMRFSVDSERVKVSKRLFAPFWVPIKTLVFSWGQFPRKREGVIRCFKNIFFHC